MNISCDDKLLCIVSSCEYKIDSNKIVYYMYLFQMAGYDFNFRYKITYNGLRSRGLNNYIDELLNLGYIIDNNGLIISSDKAVAEVSEYIMTLEDIEAHEGILDQLDLLTLDDLNFIVITDIAIREIRKKYGVDALVQNKGYIAETISKLSKEYSEENLNNAIKIIKLIKKGKI